MLLTLSPLSPTLGVEVAGINLARPIDSGRAGALRDAFREHHLLLLRGQEIDGDAQIRFATLFGPVSHRGAFMKGRDFTHVSNVREGGVLGSGVLRFHSDHTFFRHPLRAVCLYAIEIPPSGGDTLFANAAAAYANLPDRLRRRIACRRSLQLFDYGGNYNRRVLERDAAPDAPRCWHPLTLEDGAGRTVLFMHALTTAAVDGLSDAETGALIEELVAYIADPAVGYRHAWRPGDVIVWNNVTLQHARTDFDARAPHSAPRPDRRQRGRGVRRDGDGRLTGDRHVGPRPGGGHTGGGIMAEPIVEARIAWMQSFPGAWFAMGRRVADAWTALEGKSP